MGCKKDLRERKGKSIKRVKKENNDEGSIERLQCGGKDREEDRRMEKVKYNGSDETVIMK